MAAAAVMVTEARQQPGTTPFSTPSARSYAAKERTPA
jgi:hypothetical protein